MGDPNSYINSFVSFSYTSYIAHNAWIKPDKIELSGMIWIATHKKRKILIEKQNPEKTCLMCKKFILS